MSQESGNFTIPITHPDEFNGQTVVPCAVVAAVLSAILLALRFYTRICLVRMVAWEDWLILVAFVFGCGTSAGMISQLDGGLGRHIEYSIYTFGDYLRAGVFTNLAYTLSLTFTKVSILCLYVRVLTSSRARLAGKLLLAVVAVSHAYIVAVVLTTCVPLDSYWDPSKPQIYCHATPFWWANAGLLVATDFFIFLLPMPVVLRMRQPWRQKLGIIATFTLAFGVCIISVVRLAWLVEVMTIKPGVITDLTWDAVAIANWTCIEVHGAIVCACLMTLKPLLVRFFPGFMAPRSTLDDSWEDDAKAATAAHATARRAVPAYRRPLTIGTRPIRLLPRHRRDSCGSSIYLAEDCKSPGADSVDSLPIFSNVSYSDVGGGAGPRSRYPVAAATAARRYSVDDDPEAKVWPQTLKLRSSGHPDSDAPRTPPPPPAYVRRRSSCGLAEDGGPEPLPPPHGGLI